MPRRDEILAAVYEANRLHEQYNARERAEQGEGRIDVFGMLVDRDIPVMFRPLKNLLGAYVDEPDKGVMVTTQRPLPVQRLTAAHELGHEALGHEASFDEEDILTRALFVSETNYDPRELQANAFASELLTPQWLIVHHMTRQGWTRESLTDPITVYQLALRMGSSYAATCYALQECKAVSRSVCGKLLEIKPKTIKQSLAKPYEPEQWYGDVWLVTERDDGMVLEGSRSDLVVLKFHEHATSGYVWEFGSLVNTGLSIKDDGRGSTGEQHFGGVTFRTVIAEASSGAKGHVDLSEVRPWQQKGQPLNTLGLDVDLSGPVTAGLHPRQLEALLEIA